MSGKTADGGPATDLFGNPWEPPKDGRGRKRHKRIPQVAEMVAVLRAGGATQEEIARTVGISVPTLTANYWDELTDGPALARAQLVGKLYRQGMNGNVSAAKAALAQFERGDAKLASSKMQQRGPVAAQPAKLGKKEQRDEAAQGVVDDGGIYSPRRAPKLVVNNN